MLISKYTSLKIYFPIILKYLIFWGLSNGKLFMLLVLLQYCTMIMFGVAIFTLKFGRKKRVAHFRPWMKITCWNTVNILSNCALVRWAATHLAFYTVSNLKQFSTDVYLIVNRLRAQKKCPTIFDKLQITHIFYLKIPICLFMYR